MESIDNIISYDEIHPDNDCVDFLGVSFKNTFFYLKANTKIHCLSIDDDYECYAIQLLKEDSFYEMLRGSFKREMNKDRTEWLYTFYRPDGIASLDPSKHAPFMAT